MNVIATAKIIAARIRFRERPPVVLLIAMAPWFPRQVRGTARADLDDYQK
ncbi:MAG TPA: hypothetical protein VKV33_03115 [Streptosporangiaceae bacterium]|nr:hypothetical protein [Streptosporangiaceae bacterium]